MNNDVLKLIKYYDEILGWMEHLDISIGDMTFTFTFTPNRGDYNMSDIVIIHKSNWTCELSAHIIDNGKSLTQFCVHDAKIPGFKIPDNIRMICNLQWSFIDSGTVKTSIKENYYDKLIAYETLCNNCFGDDWRKSVEEN